MSPTQTGPLAEVHAYLKTKDKDFTADLPTFEQDMQDDGVRQQVYDYLRGQDKSFTATFDEFSTDLGVKKKSGGVDSGTGSLPDQTTQPPASGLVEGDQEFRRQPQVGPLGYALPGDPTAPKTYAPDYVGPVEPGTYIRPSDKGTAAEGTQYIDAPTPAATAPATEAPDVADDGFWASLGKSLYNGLDYKRVGGNVLDYVGDLTQLIANNTAYADDGTPLTPINELGRPLTNNKSTDRISADLLALAQASDLPLSQAAQQGILTNPSLAAAGNLLGSGVASIVPVAAASALAGPLAGAGVGGALGVSATKDAARAAGVRDDETTVMATVLAPIQAALEAVGVEDPGVAKLAVRATLRDALATGGGRLTAQALGSAAKKIIPEVGKRFATQGGREAVTEFLQGEAEGASKLIADAVRDPSAPGSYGATPMDALVTSPLEQAAAGALLGGGLGLTHGGTQAQNSVPTEFSTPTLDDRYYDYRRPTGQTELSNVQLVHLDEKTGQALVRGQNAEGKTFEREVPAGYLYPAKGQPAPAASAPVTEAQPEPAATPEAAAPATPTSAPEIPDPAADVTNVVDVTGQSGPIAPQAAAPPKLYAPTQESPKVAERKVSATSAPQLAVEITPDPTDPTKATFQLNPQANQERLAGDGLSQLQEFFTYNEPVGKITSLSASQPGRMELRNGEWHVTEKAGIQVQDDSPTPTPASPAEPEPSPAAPPKAAASPPDAVAGPLPAAEPHPDHVKPLTKQQRATNTVLDALDRYNALSKTEQKSTDGKARRKELIQAAGKAGLKIKDLSTGKAAIDGPRVTRSNEYTATTPANNHVPLDQRPAEARPFIDTVLSGADENPAELQGLGIKMRGKELSGRELGDAVKDIRAGRNTLRAQLVLDTLESAHQQGYLEKSTGTGLATRKFTVPVEDYLGGTEQQKAGQPVDLTDEELDAIYESDPKAKEAVDNYAFSDGTLDYERLARDEPGLSFMFDVTDETATKLGNLARERAQQSAQPVAASNSGSEQPRTPASEQAIDTANAGSTPQSDARVDEPAPASEPAAEVGPTEEKKAQIRAEIDAASQRIKDRRAARKKEGKVLSSPLPIGEIDVEDLKDALAIAKGHVQLGVLGIKNIIAKIREAGLDEEDASDAALTPHIRELLTGEPTPTLPANEPEGSATRSSMARLEADPTAPDALKQRVRDTGLDKYEPVSVADTEKAVDAYLSRNSLADAYAEAISTTDNLTGDIRTALRVRVLKAVGEQLSQAIDRGDTASADEYLGQAEKVTEALAKRGTDVGREINAYKLLVVHSPEAAVYKAQKEVAAQRAQAGEKLGKKLPKERRAIDKAKAEALDGALETKAVRAARERVVSKQAEANKPVPEARAYGESNRFFTKKGLAEVREKLKNMAFSSPLPPDLVYLGAYHLEASTRKFGDWSKKVVRDVGDRVRPHLPALYEQSRQALVTKGATDTGFDTPKSIEAQLREELANNLADRILARVRPAKPGMYDPVQEMLNTLGQRASEDLPAAQRKPKPARMALAQAINNRREYQKTLQEARAAILEKIDKLKVDDDAKQKMVDDLTEFIEQVNDRPYAKKQFDAALAQAEDAVLGGLGKTQQEQYDNLAKLPEEEYLQLVEKLQDHVTAEVQASDTEAGELREAIAEEMNSRMLLRRRAIRAKNGVFEEGHTPDKKKPVRRTLSERVIELLAARATPNQIAERVAGEAVREGVQDLGRTLDQIARDHLSDPAAIGKTLAEQFVARTGIPSTDAQLYASAIEKEFSARIDKARQSRLDQMNKRAQATPTKRASQTDLEKTAELFALSPTDDNAILDHLKRVNDLPELTARDVAELRKLAEAIRAAPEGFQQEAAVEALMKRQQKIKGLKLADIGSAIWYANVLSGYKTHVVNLTANIIQSGAELSVSTLHAVGTGKGRFSAASVKGLARGLARGGREAYSVLTTGRETSRTPGKYEVPSLLENIRFAGGAANPYNYLKLVGRGLRAGDVLFASGLKEMRAYELAVKMALEDAKSNGTPTAQVWAEANEKLYTTSQRIAEAQAQAMTEGLKGNDYQRRVYEIAEQSRGVDIMDEAREYGTRAVFNGDVKGALGWVATGIQQITNGISYKGFQPAKYIVPFTRVITNVANAYLDYTPVGAARAIKGSHLFGGDAESSMQRQFSTEERQKLAIKAVVGASLSVGAYALSHMKDDEGNPLLEISGAGTGNYLKDAQLKADGWQPYSIRVPGTQTWVTYSYTPIGAMLAVVGNLNDGEKYRGELLGDDDKPLSALYVNSMRAMQFTKDMTALKGAADFLRVLDTKNPTELSSWVERVGSGSVKGYLPWSGFLTQTAKDAEALADLPKKQGRSFGQMLYQDIPVARDGVNNALDALGDPLPIDTDRLFSAPPHRDEPTQRIWNWLNKNDLFISVPSRNSGGAMLLKLHEGKEGPMTDNEYYAFMQKRGELLKSAIESNIARLEKMPPDKAKDWLKEHAAKVNKQAKRAVFGPGAVPIGERRSGAVQDE